MRTSLTSHHVERIWRCWIVVYTLMAVACSKPPPPTAVLIETVEQARDRVCVCTDKICAQTAHEAYRVWKRTPASLHRRGLTAEQVAHLNALEAQMQQCVAALAVSPSSSPTVAAPVPTPVAPPSVP